MARNTAQLKIIFLSNIDEFFSTVTNELQIAN
jgi:hypothetical protein